MLEKILLIIAIASITLFFAFFIILIGVLLIKNKIAEKRTEKGIKRINDLRRWSLKIRNFLNPLFLWFTKMDGFIVKSIIVTIDIIVWNVVS